MAGAMRAVVAFAVVAVLLAATGGLVAAAILRAPSADLFPRPPEDSMCEDAYLFRESGTLTWLTLEGGMWEFNAGGSLYDLSGVDRFLPADRIAWLQEHEGTGIPATVEGVAEPCLATFHMRGVVVRVTALEV